MESVRISNTPSLAGAGDVVFFFIVAFEYEKLRHNTAYREPRGVRFYRLGSGAGPASVRTASRSLAHWALFHGNSEKTVGNNTSRGKCGRGGGELIRRRVHIRAITASDRARLSGLDLSVTVK
ncbi:hypothetical protein EVAR_74196_1 [Eumeta japonica]|uniref:Uncharacterized protein n=1 Tax=Eumeta variegata TaxID=151549 RepID=A0A4C1SEI6_EUMVA|nr:hypothetical protein EVAR_74196_1 [Eumeta japonica]